MSWYYNYFLGVKNKDTGVFSLLAPFDRDGEIQCVLTKSRSFASDLYEKFDKLDQDKFDERMKKNFSYEYNGETETEDVYGMPLSDLPKGDILKTGYFLLSDIAYYEKDHDSYDLFYDKMTPQEYLLRQNNELKFGEDKRDPDDDNYQRPCRDYAYYGYIDYCSKEYEAWIIRTVANMFEYRVDDNEEVWVLMTQG